MKKQEPRTRAKSPAKVVVTAAIAVLVVACGLLAAFQIVTGQGLGLDLWQVKPLIRSVADRQTVLASSRGELTNVIFLHHSTGDNLIAEGGVRERFTAAGFDFWDHHYNLRGLRRPDGSEAGYSYRVPDDNTDPDGLARIFAQREYALPLNTLSGLLQHEVIVFKSCFPASQITSDDMLRTYQEYYLGMRAVMDRHPEKVFIVMSPPPLNPAETTAEAAARARAFADWLTSDAYLAGHPNVFAFDFFDQLAEADPQSPDVNTLRAEYRLPGTDSHPNQVANEAVGPAFVDFVIAAARAYQGDRVSD
ncbi:MAG: hypothetical protein GX601_10695 [Anaerolineales bacterium]|nr:hypothetical protein [Anaerolineales bacterium]